MSNDDFEVFFREGSVIFSEGMPGDCAYIVKTGVVDLTVSLNGENVRISKFEEGELFGEMALIDQQLRSGTATAASNVSLVKVPAEFIERHVRKSDDITGTLLKVLMARYREMRVRFEKLAEDLSANQKVKLLQSSTHFGINAENASKQLIKEHELQLAFDNGYLELYFQPIIDLKQNKVAGCESLIRWIDPVRGVIPPFEFIGLAEETGLIKPIGKWIIEEACIARNEFAQIQKDIYVSVNISPNQFDSITFVDDIRQVYKKTDAQIDKVYLEITETALMSDPINVSNSLNSLKSLGVIIALDDFGTGYSSFSYLHRFPIDIIKIDQSFVFTMQKNQKSKTIVKSLCSLADSLGMNVIAEGIEQANDAQLISEFGAKFGQGYFYAKPMPKAQLLEFLKKPLS